MDKFLFNIRKEEFKGLALTLASDSPFVIVNSLELLFIGILRIDSIKL